MSRLDHRVVPSTPVTKSRHTCVKMYIFDIDWIKYVDDSVLYTLSVSNIFCQKFHCRIVLLW